VAEAPADTRDTLLVEAVRRKLLVAVVARAARGDAGDDHAVAHGEPAHRRANLGDRAYTLMPQDPPVGHCRDISLEDVQIATTYCGCVDLHDDIRRVDDLGVGHVFPRLLVRSVVHQSLHELSSKSPRARTGRLSSADTLLQPSIVRCVVHACAVIWVNLALEANQPCRELVGVAMAEGARRRVLPNRF
jgi:hypothetical protein